MHVEPLKLQPLCVEAREADARPLVAAQVVHYGRHATKQGATQALHLHLQGLKGQGGGGGGELKGRILRPSCLEPGGVKGQGGE